LFPYGSTPQAETTQDSALASVPNTPEVEAYKSAFYAEALRVARQQGYGREAKAMLERLGLTGPPSATVKATITLPVSVTVEQLFGEGTTAEQARERLAGYSTQQLAREGQRYAKYDEATVQFEVTDPQNS
jgi:phosphoglycolate phosphatase-like HAD superfamily hydrolase